MKKHIISINSKEIQKKVESYLNVDCVLEKAALLKEIKSNTGLAYIDLEGYLYEEKRTLIRINSINNLIPELLEMLKMERISKIIAYKLANLSIDEQFDYYLEFYEKSETRIAKMRKANINIHILDDKNIVSGIKSRKIHQSNLEGRLTWKDFLIIQQHLEDKQDITKSQHPINSNKIYNTN